MTVPKIVFLHSGWRTGGTALSFGLRDTSSCHLFLDPFNSQIQQDLVGEDPKPATLRRMKHPASTGGYFAEFRDLQSAGRLNQVPVNPFLTGDFSDVALAKVRNYFDLLIDSVSEQRQAVVLKIENSYGLIPWFRSWYQDSLHLRLTRDPDHQFISWLEQIVVHENGFFFWEALKTILANREFFGECPIHEVDPTRTNDLRYIFDIFRSSHERYVDWADFTLDVSPESREILSEQESLIQRFIKPSPLASDFTRALCRTRSTAPTKNFLTQYLLLSEKCIQQTRRIQELELHIPESNSVS